MDSYDEMSHLQRRSKELQTIVANLEDIKDWMAKNTGEMQSELFECVTRLGAAIAGLQDTKDIIDDKANAIEEQVYSKNAT